MRKILTYVFLFCAWCSTAVAQEIEFSEPVNNPESCTSIMVGKQASTDGSVITSHTCDGNYRTWMEIVPAATYENALRNIDEEEYILTLTQLLRSKKRTTRGKDARECYYKLLRFAAGRGFEPALAGKCLRDILGGEDYEMS